LEKVKPYTLLFDIGRSEIDSRGIDQYISWLRETISIFAGIVVYHDGCLDSIDFPLTDVRRINRNVLEVFQRLSLVAQVLDFFEPVAKNDITFKLPAYSLTQYAKFELGKNLIRSDNLESALWVDAGISRFLSGHLTKNELTSQSAKLIHKGYIACFEIDIWNNLKLFPPKILSSPIGTSRRVISGTSFWFTRNFIESLDKVLMEEIDNWLALGIWDNEQVMLRHLLQKTEHKVKYVSQLRSPTGGVARKFIESEVMSRFNSKTIQFLMTK